MAADAAGSRLAQSMLALLSLAACAQRQPTSRVGATAPRPQEPFYAAPTYAAFARSFADLRCAAWAARCETLGRSPRTTCESEMRAGLEAARMAHPIYVQELGERCLVWARHVRRRDHAEFDGLCRAVLQDRREPGKPRGAICQSSEECGSARAGEAYCAPARSGPGSCVETPLVRAGASCSASPDGLVHPQCDSGSFCADYSRRCEPYPMAGQAHAHVGGPHCMLSVDAASACQPYAKHGAPCARDGECATDYCDESTRRCAYDPHEPFQADALCGPPG